MQNILDIIKNKKDDTKFTGLNNESLRYDPIVGSRRLSNYWWASVTAIGGLGFLLSGISSYLKINLLPFSDPTELVFIPQGITMSFYGTLAIMLSTFLWLTVFWDVGGGYNKYDKSTNLITLFRFGFPGNNREVNIQYEFQDIQSIQISIKEGLNPKREIFLQTKDQRKIPLVPVGQPLLLSEVEEQAIELAKFLEVSLEGI
jgi:hypothetical protein